MLPRSRSGRWVAAVLATTLCATVAGCGFDDVEERASAAAAENLPVLVADTVDCVTHHAPELLADASTPSLAEELSDCADTQILNQDVSQALSNGESPFTHWSVAVRGALMGDELELALLTQASGVAEAGISEARAFLATCWKIVLDTGSGQLKDVSSAPCDEEVVALLHDTELVPFEDLDLGQRGAATT